jgi:hypothetical protein
MAPLTSCVWFGQAPGVLAPRASSTSLAWQTRHPVGSDQAVSSGDEAGAIANCLCASLARIVFDSTATPCLVRSTDRRRNVWIP